MSARCVWPTSITIGCEGGSRRRSSIALAASAGSWTMTTSTLSSEPGQPLGEQVLLGHRGRREGALLHVSARAAAAERVAVAGDPQPGDAHHHRPVAPAAQQPAVLGEHDRAVVGQLLRLGVRVVVAGHEHEPRAGVHDPAGELGLQRRAAVGEVADEEQRRPARDALQRRHREQVVVQVRGDGDLRAPAERRAVGRRRDQPREADELAVELLGRARWRSPRPTRPPAARAGCPGRARSTRACRGRRAAAAAR